MSYLQKKPGARSLGRAGVAVQALVEKEMETVLQASELQAVMQSCLFSSTLSD
ncbi:hypothetical protein Bca101_084160 [Brassica carinata]